MAKQPSAQISIQLSAAERHFLQDAATAHGDAFLSSYVRDAALEKSRKILGRDIERPKAGQLHTLPSSELLHAYIGVSLPGGAKQPATLFPSIHTFAALLSDRNRAVLRWLAENRTQSIQEIANALDYPYPALSRALGNLEAYHLIAFTDGARQSRIPVLLHDRLKLFLPFRMPVAGNVLRLSVQSAETECPASGTDRVLKSMAELSSAIPGRNGYTVLKSLGKYQPHSIAELAAIIHEAGV